MHSLVTKHAFTQTWTLPFATLMLRHSDAFSEREASKKCLVTTQRIGILFWAIVMATV